MSKKVIASPIGQLQWYNDATVLVLKTGVATAANLPMVGNTKDDARFTADTGHLYSWDSTQWIDNGDVLDVSWSAIVGKPYSAVADIDDAVSKKHTQNTDTAIIGYSNNFINTLSGVVVTASGYYNDYVPTRVADGNLDFGSGAWFNNVSTGWLKFDLDVAPKMLTSFKFYFDILYGGGVGIKDFTIQGSNDDSLWDDLYTGQMVNVVGWQQFNFSNTTSYRYYRINILSPWEPNTNIFVTEVEASELIVAVSISGDNIYDAVSKKHAQNTDAKVACPSSEPVDETLNNNEVLYWVDEGAALLKFKVKDSSNIVKSGSIPLV